MENIFQTLIRFFFNIKIVGGPGPENWADYMSKGRYEAQGPLSVIGLGSNKRIALGIFALGPTISRALKGPGYSIQVGSVKGS